MASPKTPSSNPGHVGVLGNDGTIDLTGAASSHLSKHDTIRPSGDAWSVDRKRRTLAPPPGPLPGQQTTHVPVPDDIHLQIADRFALGDYAAALSAAELQLGVDPNDQTARQYAETSRQRLEARYVTRIGSLDWVFNLAVPATRVKWLGLDPQAAFLLSLVDGQSTVDQVLEACRMKRLEALRVFAELLDAKAIVRVA